MGCLPRNGQRSSTMALLLVAPHHLLHLTKDVAIEVYASRILGDFAEKVAPQPEPRSVSHLASLLSRDAAEFSICQADRVHHAVVAFERTSLQVIKSMSL
jgi:hypothetical protein